MWFLLLNGVVFIFLVTLQFAYRGNFSQRIGNMLVSGRYAPDSDRLDGGANVFFGGLEFRLGGTAGADIGFSVVGSDGRQQQVFPESMIIEENSVVFTLPGGSELSFAQNAVPELRISGKFSGGVSLIHIPFRTQRSSVIRDSSDGTLNISYNGNRYQFSRSSHGLDTGLLILSAAAPAISYRTVSGEREFNPAHYMVAQAETPQAFSGAVSRWIARNFALWSQMGLQTDEDTVIAWCGEAVRQDLYSTAVATIPVSFSSSPLRTWESAVYQFDRRIGVWGSAVGTIGNVEREKAANISRLLAGKDSRLFLEKHLIAFLAVRNYDSMVHELAAFAQEMDPGIITLAMSPGILESCLDMAKWYPHIANPFEALAERAYRLAAGSMRRIGDQVFVVADGRAADTEFNLRLGKALGEWGEVSGKNDWAGLGRSLALSVLALSADDGSVPALLPVDGSRDFNASGGRISSAKLYRILHNSEYLPHATTTGTTGIWAYTVSPSVRVVQNEREMDIAIRFPVGETHYVMIRNVRPFALLQIYDMNWRMASDFESYYDSSGWFYFGSERTLVIKIRHRSNVEHIKVFFVPPPPPPAPPDEEEDDDEMRNEE